MNGLFAVDVPETMLKEYTVSFIKIIHVHADPNQITGKVAFRNLSGFDQSLTIEKQSLPTSRP